MRKLSSLSIGLVLVLAQGCASMEEIREAEARESSLKIPLVDEKIIGFNGAKYDNTDYPECWSYANRSVQQGSVGEGAVGGAMAGASVGALTGAFLGDAGFGAGVGAAYGAIGGATQQVAGAENAATVTMRNCLKGRGYSVLF